MNQLKNYFKQLPFLWAIKFTMLHLLRKLITSNFGLSFAQSGEDRVLANYIDTNKKGFYIDIGANDPINLSNTFLFYSRGWKGITIDADESLIAKHKKIRINDTSICAALSSDFITKKYYQYENSAYNTLDKEMADNLVGQIKVKQENILETVPLNHLLIQYESVIPQKIDLLSIDIEGMDFDIIQSLDFKRFNPEFIIIEMHKFSLEKANDNQVYLFLKEKGYVLIGFVAMNGYFKKMDV
jgi:FkbM family methyltransferase